MEPMADIVERYLRAVATQDWDVVDHALPTTLSASGLIGTATRVAKNISPSSPT